VRTLIVIPTVDEAANITAVLERVRAAMPLADVLVVDGASADGTATLAEADASRLGRIEVVRQPARDGLGGAYRLGFTRAIDDGYEVVVEMDADLSHEPEDLPRLVAGIEGGARLVIGSRYVAGGDVPDWSRRRRWLSRWANRYVRLMLRLGVNDATAGFRAYRTSALREVDHLATRADGYAFQVELTERVVRTGGGVLEVPVVFHDRRGGRSKMSGRIVLEAMVLVTGWAIEERVLRRRRWERRTGP
jgi:dolichol-phosphate mannosyltransferase